MNQFRVMLGNSFYDFYLSYEERSYFGNRMTESSTGAVQVPTRLYEKFRNITGLGFAKNHEIKEFLIRNCY